MSACLEALVQGSDEQSRSTRRIRGTHTFGLLMSGLLNSDAYLALLPAISRLEWNPHHLVPGRFSIRQPT